MKILAVIPGIDYTSVALYEEYNCLWGETLWYDEADLAGFPNLMAQESFRADGVLSLLDSKGERPGTIQAFVASGGLLHPVEGGVYPVNINMLEDLQGAEFGESPLNLGATIVSILAKKAESRYAYVVDPPVVDEMSEVAHMTGLPEVSYRSFFHALSQRAVARREAGNLGRPIADCNFIVCHFSDCISIGAHAGGKVVEVNDLNGASGPMSLRQSGDLPPLPLIDLCFSGRYTVDELKNRVLREGGLSALLGTSDFAEIVRRVRGGDRMSLLAFDAFVHRIVCNIGACAAVLNGRIDATILTGSLVVDEFFCRRLIDRIAWIAPIVAYPGENDMLALVEGALRVLRGAEEPQTYA